jgi:RimJ/RimL family protein N-acetyltransferase
VFSESLQIREVNSEDCALLFTWVNEDGVRVNSIQSNFITWENHVRWFSEKLLSVNTKIFILEQGGVAVGQVRFDKDDKDYWVIDYSIDPNFRSKGFGGLILSYGIKQFPLNTTKFVGYVKNTNKASIKVFEKLNFKKEKVKISGGAFYKFTCNERH